MNVIMNKAMLIRSRSNTVYTGTIIEYTCRTAGKGSSMFTIHRATVSSSSIGIVDRDCV